ncbi:MAG: hypothetical protein ABI947_26320 [Chloroflexota bacterium]
MIMVQMSERAWTLKAIHLACTLARGTNTGVALVKMLPVQHLGWLGTEFGYQNFTQQDHLELRDYLATAEDYAVEVSTHVFQYATLYDAIADAANYVKASIVFANIPDSRIPYWHKFQIWSLRQRLISHQQKLYMLDTPIETSTHEHWSDEPLLIR